MLLLFGGSENKFAVAAASVRWSCRIVVCPGSVSQQSQLLLSSYRNTQDTSGLLCLFFGLIFCWLLFDFLLVGTQLTSPLRAIIGLFGRLVGFSIGTCKTEQIYVVVHEGALGANPVLLATGTGLFVTQTLSLRGASGIIFQGEIDDPMFVGKC